MWHSSALKRLSGPNLAYILLHRRSKTLVQARQFRILSVQSKGKEISENGVKCDSLTWLCLIVPPTNTEGERRVGGTPASSPTVGVKLLLFSRKLNTP